MVATVVVAVLVAALAVVVLVLAVTVAAVCSVVLIVTLTVSLAENSWVVTVRE